MLQTFSELLLIHITGKEDYFHKWRSSDNTQKFNKRLSDGVNFKFRKHVYKNKETEFYIHREVSHFGTLHFGYLCFRQQFTQLTNTSVSF